MDLGLCYLGVSVVSTLHSTVLLPIYSYVCMKLTCIPTTFTFTVPEPVIFLLSASPCSLPLKA